MDVAQLFCYALLMKKYKRKILSYFAVFEAAVEGGYAVSFPDFPGCVTFGRTFEEAKLMASEVLELWLVELRSQHESIPRPYTRPVLDTVEVAVPA